MENQYLSVHDQINYLKERNVTFNLMNEKRAIEILLHESYFHKLLNYKHVLSRFRTNEIDDFNGIEFNDLVELKAIDSSLRELFNDITLEIEHYFKVLILRHVDCNPKRCDHYFYYDIVDIDKVYRINNRMKKRIKNYDDYYSRKHLKKFPDQKPIWVLNEYLSFGEVLEIFTTYVRKYKLREFDTLIHYLKAAKLIRNITAHNNTLYMRSQAVREDVRTLRSDLDVLANVRLGEKYIETNFTNKLASTLLVYKLLAPKEIYDERLNKIYIEIHTLIKKYEVFERYPNEVAIKDVKYLCSIINKLY